MIPYQSSPAERSFNNCVVAHLKNFADTIDVTRFINMNRWSMAYIADLYIKVLWDNPEIFYVAKSSIQVTGSVFPDGRARFAKLTGIRYAFRKEDYPHNKSLLDAEVKRAVKYAAGESSTEMVALRLHDYIVKTCEYDTVAADTNDPSPLSRTAFSVLVRRKAVCEGYTMAYRYLLRKFNIISEEIISTEMCHCWNYVYIKGNWYHVDVTYDDPVFIDSTGRILRNEQKFLLINSNISRENFLMSDYKARQNKHYGWDTKGLARATDVTYDCKNWP